MYSETNYIVEYNLVNSAQKVFEKKTKKNNNKVTLKTNQM